MPCVSLRRSANDANAASRRELLVVVVDVEEEVPQRVGEFDEVEQVLSSLHAGSRLKQTWADTLSRSTEPL